MKGRKPQTKQPMTGMLTVVPSPPKWLTANAKSEWRRVAKHLVERRVLSEPDLGTLTSYCVAVGVVRDSMEAIACEGDIIDGKRNPRYTSLEKAMTAQRQYAAELGLSPTARSKVGVQSKQEDEAAQWAELGVE